MARRPAPRDRGQLQLGVNVDSASAASVAHDPATRRRHPPTGSREARHLRPPTGRATRVPRSRRLSDTTVVHARALCKISRPARGQWWRTDGRLRWRRAGSLQHRAPGALWSAGSGASRHGRRKAVTAGAAGARSRLRKSQSNLPLGFTGMAILLLRIIRGEDQTRILVGNSVARRINELYYASVDTTPRVQKTLSLIYPNLKSQLGDRHYMLLRRSAEGSPPGL